MFGAVQDPRCTPLILSAGLHDDHDISWWQSWYVFASMCNAWFCLSVAKSTGWLHHHHLPFSRSTDTISTLTTLTLWHRCCSWEPVWNLPISQLSPPCARCEIHLYDCRVIGHWTDPTDYFELLSDLKKNCIYLFGQGNTLYTHLHLRRDKFYMNKVAEKAQQ